MNESAFTIGLKNVDGSFSTMNVNNRLASFLHGYGKLHEKDAAFSQPSQTPLRRL